MSSKANRRPRIGVPWRTAKEERAKNTKYYRNYLQAVADAGGDPVEVSLLLAPAKLKQLAATLDAVVLPGSPADVDPKRYRSRRRKQTAKADSKRETTDIALLKDAFAARKPVLAICYGTQLLNVHLGGTLVQDIPRELRSKIGHERIHGEAETYHTVRIDGGHLSKLAAAPEVRVNSSHHQSIGNPGRKLRVTARARDGVVEAIEWTGGPQWVVGVQWHPERMGHLATRGATSRSERSEDGHALAGALFRRLVIEARAGAKRPAKQPLSRKSPQC